MGSETSMEPNTGICPVCGIIDERNDKCHELICAEDFHTRVAKMLKLLSSGKYVCHGYNRYQVLLIGESKSFTIRIQNNPKENTSHGSLCLLCGRENKYMGPMRYRMIVVGKFDIWRCDECHHEDVRMCAREYLPIDVCKRRQLDAIADRYMLIAALTDVLDLRKYIVERMMHTCE